jgi:hypothetical protein
MTPAGNPMKTVAAISIFRNTRPNSPETGAEFFRST